MNNDIEKIFVSAEEINDLCQKLGKQITHDYEGKKPLFIGLLKGCVPFLAQLIKNVDLMMEFDFMDVDSYFGGTSSTGHVQILKDISTDVVGKDILIVDDIIDTGLTLSFVVDLLKKRGAASIEVVTLLDKPAGRTVHGLIPKYIGTTIENQFVVGFGLDYCQYYRNLPYIGILKETVYKKLK